MAAVSNIRLLVVPVHYRELRLWYSSELCSRKRMQSATEFSIFVGPFRPWPLSSSTNPLRSVAKRKKTPGNTTTAAVGILSGRYALRW